jgi:hypothetical protein
VAAGGSTSKPMLTSVRELSVAIDTMYESAILQRDGGDIMSEPNAHRKVAAPSERTAPPDVTGVQAEDPVSLPAGSAPCDEPVLSELPPFDMLGLLKQQLAQEEPVELSAAEIARLPRAGDEPPDLDEVPWWLSEEFTGSDAELEAAFLRNLPADIRAEYAAGPWTGAGEVFAAGFVHHDAGVGPRPDGFAAGGEHDVLLPGPELAAAAAQATRGLAGLGESELIGVMCAWQRLTAWAQARQAACIDQLIRRRKDQSVALKRPSLACHVDDEVAAALALTGRSAGRLLQISAGLARQPSVLRALEAGRIDWVKASLFTDYLAGLPDADAADIAACVLEGADRKTSGQLRAALVRAVLAYDPESAQRRRDAARKDACVQSWGEPSGNAVLAGRELEPADVVDASARLTACAKWLHDHGAAGSIDELRAAAYIALLTGQPLDSLLPSAPYRSTADDASTDGASTADAGETSGRAGAATPASDGSGASAGLAGGPLTGSINLTMPMSAWLGQSGSPGELAGYGPADARTCAELARRAGPAARWSLILTDVAGRAVAHARAPAGSPPPATWAGAIRWVAGLRESLQTLESGTCSHARRSSSYRPPTGLAHLVRVRQRTCSFPGCRRPARQCDLDHSVPFDQGGATCECNLAPLCRRHHQAKQAPGWQLTQPRPGEMSWRLPSGRTYATCPEPYPV